jgi:hypothetical protein
VLVKAVLVVGTIADLGLAALLIAGSGFIFGGGPESMHAGASLGSAYIAAIIGCLTAPVAGIMFSRRGKTTPGLLLAWTPPAGALLALAIPPY